MNLLRVSYAVFFLAIAITVVAPDDTDTTSENEVAGSVQVKDTTVTLTCPFGDESTVMEWEKKGSKISPTDKYLTLNNYNDKDNGLYSCKEKDLTKKHYFYIKAKVCEGCIDLDPTLGLLVVFADVLITLVIVFIIYFCNRKNAGTAGPQRPTQARQGRAQARGPPIPDPDYQPLNQTTRSADVYATAHRR